MSHLVWLLSLPSFELRLPEVFSGWHNDDDFEGKRNYAVLLVLLVVPSFWLVVMGLGAWLIWS